ncbi:MAG: DUF2141 domain-containing protein [Alphaproteobacteria bacterium]|nr:DUF2141 domain-containing protein [Alphaproteobacteria bacterium]
MFLSALLASMEGAAAAPALVCSGEPTAFRLTVSVTDLKSAEGQVAITVYPDEEKRFLAAGGKLARQRVSAVAPTTAACFYLPAAGYYAVAIYHDANANHDFDRTMLGFPDEGFGFSRDPQSTVGLPDLDEVRFPVAAGDTAITIHTRYP